MTDHVITVQRVVESDDPIPHDARVTIMQMHINGKVTVRVEHGDKADRIAAGEYAKRLGFMAVFGD